MKTLLCLLALAICYLQPATCKAAAGTFAAPLLVSTNDSTIVWPTDFIAANSLASTSGTGTNYAGLTVTNNVNFATNIFSGTSGTLSLAGKSFVSINPTGNFTLTIADTPAASRRMLTVQFNGNGVRTLTFAGDTITARFGTFANPPRNGITLYILEALGGTLYRDVLAPLTADDMPSGIDSANIADGSVSSGDFETLAGANSNLQAQLDALSARLDALE